MTILFLTRLFYPHIGGVERHVLEVGNRLLKQGHKVVIVTESLDKKFQEQKLDPQTAEMIKEFEIYRIPIKTRNWFTKFTIWAWLWKHKKLIKQADVVHCHDVFFWYLPFRFIFPRKPVFITFHGYEGKYPVSKKAIVVRKISEKLAFGNICVGDFIKKWYGTKPTIVTYGGINMQQRAKGVGHSENKELKIIFIGRLEADIGISAYLDSLKELKKINTQFEVNFLGDGEYRKEAMKLGVVHGFVQNVDEYIKKADIVFASSYLSIGEALTHKKIVIAVYGNPLKEDYLRMSPFTKYIFICENSDAITEVIQLIHKDPWKTKTMIEDGYAYIKEQTWEKVTDQYVKLWNSKAV